MNKILVYIISIIATLCVIITLAFTAMQVVIFNENSYKKSFEENELYDFIDVDKEDLHEITSQMLDYLKGKREDLIMYAQIRGEQQQVFEEREILHMIDVQKLFLGGMKIRNTSAIIGFTLLLLLFILQKKKSIKPLCKSYLWVMMGIMSLAIALGIMMAIDFSVIFTKFHLMFFDNDLWLLDINTDVLIQMLPESLFNKMAMSIVAYMSVFILTPAIFSIGYLIVNRKKNAKQ